MVLDCKRGKRGRFPRERKEAEDEGEGVLRRAGVFAPFYQCSRRWPDIESWLGGTLQQWLPALPRFLSLIRKLQSSGGTTPEGILRTSARDISGGSITNV